MWPHWVVVLDIPIQYCRMLEISIQYFPISPIFITKAMSIKFQRQIPIPKDTQCILSDTVCCMYAAKFQRQIPIPKDKRTCILRYCRRLIFLLYLDPMFGSW